jgi:hypothetical protein
METAALTTSWGESPRAAAEGDAATRVESQVSCFECRRQCGRRATRERANAGDELGEVGELPIPDEVAIRDLGGIQLFPHHRLHRVAPEPDN